jgi:hypothetical protein
MPRPSPARDRLLRTLLTSKARNLPRQAGTPKIVSLYGWAQQCGVSFPWVHEVAHELAANGFIELQPELRVKDAEGLYAWWRKNSSKPTIVSFHAAEPMAVLRDAAARAHIQYALTTYYAENWLQGHLFPRRVDAYIRPADLPSMRVAILAAGGQLGGTNMRLWMRDDHLTQEAYKVGNPPVQQWYAPPAQVLLDLYEEGGSAAEAADMLVRAAYA